MANGSCIASLEAFVGSEVFVGWSRRSYPSSASFVALSSILHAHSRVSLTFAWSYLAPSVSIDVAVGVVDSNYSLTVTVHSGLERRFVSRPRITMHIRTLSHTYLSAFVLCVCQ
jgi:hypothetical protein